MPCVSTAGGLDWLTDWLTEVNREQRKKKKLLRRKLQNLHWSPPQHNKNAFETTVASTSNQHFAFTSLPPPCHLTLSSIRSWTLSFSSKQGWGKLCVTRGFCLDSFSSFLMEWTPSSTSFKLHKDQESNQLRGCFSFITCIFFLFFEALEILLSPFTMGGSKNPFGIDQRPSAHACAAFHHSHERQRVGHHFFPANNLRAITWSIVWNKSAHTQMMTNWVDL